MLRSEKVRVLSDLVYSTKLLSAMVVNARKQKKKRAIPVLEHSVSNQDVKRD